MKTDGLQHPKTNRLMVILDLKRYEAVGILECLFGFASRWCDDGRIGKYTPAELAADIGWQGPPGVLIEGLTDAGFLDGQGDQLRIHDWTDHCAEYVKKRIKRRQGTGATGASKAPVSLSPAANGGQRQPTAANGRLPNPSLPNPSPPTAEVEGMLKLFRSLKGFAKPNRTTRRIEQMQALVELHGVDRLILAARCFPLEFKFSNENWTPNIDWLCKPGTIDKLTEGHYGAPRASARERLLRQVLRQGERKLEQTDDPTERADISEKMAAATRELGGKVEQVA